MVDRLLGQPAAASGVRSMPLAKPQAPSCTTRTAKPDVLVVDAGIELAVAQGSDADRIRSRRKSACSAPSSRARLRAASARAEAGRARNAGSMLAMQPILDVDI